MRPQHQCDDNAELAHKLRTKMNRLIRTCHDISNNKRVALVRSHAGDVKREDQSGSKWQPLSKIVRAHVIDHRIGISKQPIRHVPEHDLSPTEVNCDS